MADVNTLLQTLEQVLDREIATYQELLERQQTERQLVITQALEPLLANLQAKQYLVWQLTKIEHTRQTVLEELAALLGLSDMSLTLRQLSARVDEPYTSTLLEQREQLHAVVENLHRVHTDHALLLRDSLVFVDNALMVLESLMGASGTYQQTGEVHTARQGRFLSGRI